MVKSRDGQTCFPSHVLARPRVYFGLLNENHKLPQAIVHPAFTCDVLQGVLGIFGFVPCSRSVRGFKVGDF